MKTFIATLLISLLLSLLLTRLARYFGRRFDLVDVGGGRKVHKGAIPRLGGPAIALATLLPLLPLTLVDNQIADRWNSLGTVGLAIILGSIGAMLLGLWDDIKHLRARNKLAVQILLATCAYFMGLKIQMITLPLAGTLDMGIFALPVTVFWFVGFMNIVNLIDGMDGLCGGIVTIASVAIFAVALSNDALVVCLFTAAVTGALLGFLRFNFPPASIFMGDSGSYFLGFLFAAISITGSQKTTLVIAIATPLLALGVPILDTLLAISRRLISGRPIFSPDRGHLHHQLIDSGHSTRKAIGIFYGITALLSVAGIVVAIGRQLEAGIALATSAVLIIYLIRIVANRASDKDIYPISKANELLTVLPQYLSQLYQVSSVQELEAWLQAFAVQANLLEAKIKTEKFGEGSFTWKNGRNTEERGNCLHFEHPLQHQGEDVAHLQFSWRTEYSKPSRETFSLLKLTTLILAERYTHIFSKELGLDEETMRAEKQRA